jgi:hypothetical protein
MKSVNNSYYRFILPSSIFRNNYQLNLNFCETFSFNIILYNFCT